MKINVSDLLKKKVLNKNLNLVLEEKGFSDGTEYISFVKPIKFDGNIRLIENVLHLKGTASMKIELVCSRCLEKFCRDMEFDIYEKFSNNNNIVNKDDDCIFIDSDDINITKIIESNLVEILPIKRICKKDCLGLCQKCGINLNYSTCDCDKKEIDPRLAKLKDLFKSN